MVIEGGLELSIRPEWTRPYFPIPSAKKRGKDGAGSAGFPAEDGEVEIAAQDEAESAVDADGRFIAGQDVKEGRAAVVEDVVHGDANKDARKAATACVGVRADGADLDEVGQVETLAGHGKEGFALEDAPEAPELAGVLAEGAGLGEGGEFAHGGDIGGGETAEEKLRVQPPCGG